MFYLVLNTRHILSRNFTWYVYWPKADSRFYVVNIRDGLTKNILQEDKIYCFKCQKVS